MLAKQPYLESKKEKIIQEMKEVRHRAAVNQIRQEMLDRVVSELALEVVKENMYLSKKIDGKMMDILVRALKLEKNSKTVAGDLQILAQNLEDEKLVAARESIMNLFEEKEIKTDKLDVPKTFEDKWWEMTGENGGPKLEPSKMDDKCALI